MVKYITDHSQWDSHSPTVHKPSLKKPTPASGPEEIRDCCCLHTSDFAAHVRRFQPLNLFTQLPNRKETDPELGLHLVGSYSEP